MKIVGIFAVAAALGGCMGSLPANPTVMSADQLREWVKDKNANISCLVANSPYGKGNAMVLVLDKGVVVPNGTLSVDDSCKVSITNNKPFPPPQ